MRSRKNRDLTRRTFLRAGGVSLALPWLESLAPASTPAARAPAGLPRRCIYAFSCNGVWNETFLPREAGAAYTMPETLEPLAALRRRFSILSSMYHPDMPAGHTFNGCYLTGANEFRRTLPISADQMAARAVGRGTRFASLQIARTSSLRTSNAFDCISFDANGVPLPPEHRPDAIFTKLFVNDSADAIAIQRRRFDERRSILDGLLEQARALDRRISSDDRPRVQQYLDSIRGVENEIARDERFLTQPRPTFDDRNAPLAAQLRAGPAPLGAGSGKREWLRVMYELMRLALQTDQTRVISFVPVERISFELYSELGIRNHHHRVSHMWNDPNGVNWTKQIDRLHIEELARFVTSLSETREGERSLLDTTVIVYAYEAGNAHAFKPWPALVLGGDALGLRHGHHLRYDGDVRLTNLHLTVLRALGMEINRFSDSTGTLTGLV